MHPPQQIIAIRSKPTYTAGMAENILIAGVDEVGRGPLAGPVVTAAVILDPEKPIEGLADSKKLSEKKTRTTV